MAETGSFAIVLPVPRIRFYGVYGGPYPPDTSNALAGLDLVSVGTVTVIRPPAPVPPGLVEAVKYDVALPYAPPVIINGRPT